MTRPAWRRYVLLLPVTWLLALSIAYAFVHNPLTVGGFQAISWRVGAFTLRDVLSAAGRNLRNLAGVALLLAVAGALGRSLLHPAHRLSPPERVSLQALLGMGLLAFPVLVIGLLGLFPPAWLAWLLTLGIAAALWRPLKEWLADLIHALRAVFAPEPDAFTRWLRRAVIMLLTLAFILAFAPPTKWDALTYHLAGPKHYLEAGRIVSFQENHFLNFPQVMSLLFLWLMILAGPEAAALLHGVIGWLLLLSMIGLAGRVRRPGAGWLAAAILLTADSLWMEFFWAYNDLATMAFIFAALILLLDCGERSETWSLIWAGAFVGLAMGTKYTAAGASLAVGLLAAWLNRRNGLVAILRAVGMLSITALIVFAPWPVKNTLLDANPIAPFGPGTEAFDKLDQWYYLRPGTGLKPLELLLVPVQATVFGEEGGPYQASSGALLVGLLPLVLVGWKQRDADQRALLSNLLIFTLPAYLIWLVGAGVSWFLLQTRLLYPLFPALALAAALAAVSLPDLHLPLNLKPLVYPVILAMLALAVLNSTLIFFHAGALRVVAGVQPQEEYLLQTLQAHYAAMQAVNELPQDAEVLFVWEPRTFYCERRCLPDSMIDRWWHDRQLQPDPHAIAANWRARGVTHVLIFEAGGLFLFEQEPFDPLTGADMQALDTLRSHELIPVWDVPGAYTLYALQVETP
jgi:hypothetical protein